MESNTLEQLVRMALPSDTLDRFAIVKIETDEDEYE